jgi:hypothetical protein
MFAVCLGLPLFLHLALSLTVPALTETNQMKPTLLARGTGRTWMAIRLDLFMVAGPVRASRQQWEHWEQAQQWRRL